MANNSATLRSLCPMYMSRMSASEMQEGRAELAGDRLGQNVLPQPGGPYSNSPPRSDLP
ncbi:MAG: hypothetical protein R2731_18855 [Nocardioides sp.]